MKRLHGMYRFVMVTVILVLMAGSMTSCEETSGIRVEESAEPVTDISRVQSVSESEELIYVYVTGRVQNPDVYKVSPDSRIYQVIDMAGGFLEDADTEIINLADRVYDGMKITVYAIGEEGTWQSIQNGVENGLININVASKEQLMTLPGIGETKAESIIRYREENGRFKTIEDIMNISGIKEGAFSKIKELITI